jgi:hypothetical protein
MIFWRIVYFGGSVVLLLLTSCQLLRQPAANGDAAYAASIEIVEAEASLQRVVEPEGIAFEEDFFLLRTSCVLRVNNRSGRDQEVLSFFGSAFDDLRLRIRNEQGEKLTTTTHTLWTEPLIEGQWHPLKRGITMVELSSATLVGPGVPDDEYPMIIDRDLTQVIHLEYFGGFPGSDLARAVQSNQVKVTISDRTTEVPRRPVPLPQTTA